MLLSIKVSVEILFPAGPVELCAVQYAWMLTHGAGAGRPIVAIENCSRLSLERD